MFRRRVRVTMTDGQVIDTLRALANPANVAGMARYGISNHFARTVLAREKAAAWSGRPETFVKRAGFVLMACIAVHDKKADDAVFTKFLHLIIREAGDDRNFVKKAVNWALRQIGKRNPDLNNLAVETAREIRKIDAPSARWIAADALRELTDERSWRRWRKTDRKTKPAAPCTHG
jgi:hypothetical protein